MNQKYVIDEIIEENDRRRKALADPYDPIRGVGACGDRQRVFSSWHADYLMLPTAMLADPDYKRVKSAVEFDRLRHRHDFEFWAASCVKIRHKVTGLDVAMVLNRAQRKVLGQIERMRLAQMPIRLIMLKARQWGGSTLIQMYFAWIQILHRRNWHSLICAQVKNTSSVIRGMYDKMLASYPEIYWTGEQKGKFKPFQGSDNTREIVGRDCNITLASSLGQEAARGHDCAMAHLSEVAFWRDTDRMSPEAFIRAVCGGIPMVPLSFIAMESTANGIGNFFHSEWLRAKAGASDKEPVFVAWYEIEMYSRKVTDVEGLLNSMDSYEWALWERGLTLEQICWYHYKRREFSSHSSMKAEYPTDDIEAFANTGCGVFALEHIEAMRPDCREPECVGELSSRAPSGVDALADIHFSPDPLGLLKVWEKPEAAESRSGRYVVAVDIGGRSASSDYSVIAVIDRQPRADDPRPRVVAQWRGHLDHDLLAWKAAAIASWYCDALLVVESNTLESNHDGDSQFILETIGRHYPNLYRRSGSAGALPGFHTNRATKGVIISLLIALVRDGAYVERDSDALSEMATYELQPDGSYAAKRGYHDDILMTRAIGLYIATSTPWQSAMCCDRLKNLGHTI